MIGFDAWVVGVVTRALLLLPLEGITTVVWLVGVRATVPVPLFALLVSILGGLVFPSSVTLPLSWRGPIFEYGFLLPDDYRLPNALDTPL
jgi:hypothetical protein